jgi:pyruvate dehydrogenase E2 component (dihydrolipoamide acetyltransferase)
METGTLAEWLKRDGDTVKEGDILFTVETDKVAQEVEAMDSGILRIAPDAAQAGASIPVGAVMAYLLQPGEHAPFEQQAAGARPALVSAADGAVASSATAWADAVAMPAPAAVNGRGLPAVSPRARRVAQELGVDWTALVGSGRTGRIVERDVRAAATQLASSRTRITPLARRAAQQAGVDVEELAGQLPGKRITRADIEAATRVTPEPAPAPVPVPVPATAGGPGRPMSQVRRIIADRMAASAHTVAPVTLTTEADATELVALRARIKQALAGSNRPVPSYTDLLARLVALVLQEHPALNSSLAGDTIIPHEAVHMGIAADTEQGLLVPVVHDAHLKSIQRIAAESAELIARARAGKSKADDLGGSTFTITNLGMYDIDAFTPIINLPDCAILGLGRIVARQVVIDEDTETVAIRKMLALSLTFDHRVVDGAPAARFLQQVKRWIEQPYAWVTA